VIDLDYEVQNSFGLAVDRLMANDGDLLLRNVSERAIASRLAMYLTELFPSYDLDVEYDRHGLEVKRLHLPADCHGGGIRRVIPDIVVHIRGDNDHNLLAVEIKKETNRESRTCDRLKLRGMLDQLHYSLAVFLEVPAGPGAVNRSPVSDWMSPG
jgi:hypothetical protein